MSVLYLFNPENDLALANGGKNYTPPPLARTIARDLSTLPLWYATEGENIICLPSLGYGDSLIPVLESLGKKLGISNREISGEFKEQPMIDYQYVDNVINEMRRKSLLVLKTRVSEI